MKMPDRSRVIHFAEAQASIPVGERSARVWQRGALDVAFALATFPKEQTPHTQDEIYIIVSGRGVLIKDLAIRDVGRSHEVSVVASAHEMEFKRKVLRNAREASSSYMK